MSVSEDPSWRGDIGGTCDGEDVSAELLRLARSGQDEAFAHLVAPHCRELHVHCYRILGSVADADDALPVIDKIVTLICGSPPAKAPVEPPGSLEDQTRSAGQPGAS